MSQLPTSVRAAVGLAATVLDRLRKLPQEAPELPAQLVTSAMQLSMRAQQELATLITRGDEVLGHLHETPDDPPAWATFDDGPPVPPADVDAAVTVVEPGASEPAAPVAEDVPRKAAKRAPATKAPATKTTARKSPAKKVAAQKVAQKVARKAPAKRAPRRTAPVEAASAEALVRSLPAESTFDRTPDPDGPPTV